MDSLLVENSSAENTAGSLESARLLAQVFLGLFLTAFALVGIGYELGTPAFVKFHLLWTALLGLAAVSTLVSLARQLPWQNVLLVGLLLALSGISFAVMLISTGSCLGFYSSPPVTKSAFLLSKLLPLALVWIVAILNCRGVVRLALRRWRFTTSFGLWVLSATTLLANGFLLSLVLLGPLRLDWQVTTTLPWCAVGTLITLLLVTPSLINKRPVPQPVDWHPLVIWVAFNLWLVVGAAAQGRWIITGLILSEILVVMLFVGYGATDTGSRPVSD